MRHFIKTLESKKLAPRVVYLSTTGVYGDCQGEWIDETQPLNPTSDRAQRRVDAEQQLLQWRQRSGAEVVILRVAGIYGPERYPVRAIAAGNPVLNPAEAPFSNRIHIDDLVQICRAAVEKGRDGEIYNVADGSPSTMADYFFHVADVLSLPRPPLVDWATAQETFSPVLLSYLKENRRISAKKLLADLELDLLHPELGVSTG